MKIALVGHHLPLAEGTATGRAFWALGEGLVAEGHDVIGWAWRPEPPAPGESLPTWCEWRPVPPSSWVLTKARALVRPRHEVGRTAWRVPEDFVGVADESVSWPAVAHAPHNVVTFHYLTALDGPAVGRRPTPKDRQDLRFERRAAARATAVLAYSERVAAAAAPERAVVVPIAQLLPTEALAPVDEPVAAMLADWRWAPNQVALGRLLAEWPDVRARVPGARLLLGGRYLEAARVGTIAGVELVGEVPAVADLLARSAVLAFPCPPSSGPKVKVLDALCNGVPAVTTPAGVEGL
ncbi:MAG: hypothetical protein QOJ67_1279, partial [Acidimicrobiaceae bacterium]